MTVWQNISLDSGIIIVHPNYRQHRYLLSNLLNLSSILYLRFDEAFHNDWLTEDKNYDFIILDEFDRLAEEQADKILDTLLNKYPQSWIILFSRNLPDLQPKHRSQASLFPINEEIGLVDYYRQARTIVEFFGFGRGAIAINGKPQDLFLEDTQLLMLFYLLEKGRVKLSTLLELFWGGVNKKNAKALHNLKPRLNMLLGVDLLIYHRGFYQLNPSLEIVYDVANYQRLVEAAYHAPPNLSANLFAQAHEAYKGDYLQGCQAAWVKALRQALQRTQADAQAHLGEIYAEKAQKEEATAWYSFAFKHNPARDDVLLALMRLFIELKMPCYALSFFNRYEEILRERHGISPKLRFEALYKKAKADCDAYSSSL